jgi:hypothetical protein
LIIHRHFFAPRAAPIWPSINTSSSHDTSRHLGDIICKSHVNMAESSRITGFAAMCTVTAAYDDPESEVVGVYATYEEARFAVNRCFLRRIMDPPMMEYSEPFTEFSGNMWEDELRATGDRGQALKVWVEHLQDAESASIFAIDGHRVKAAPR